MMLFLALTASLVGAPQPAVGPQARTLDLKYVGPEGADGWAVRFHFTKSRGDAAPTYVLRAASDDIVPHSHTNELVSKLACLHHDEIIPDSDHLNIPYLPTTQQKIASFLQAQFTRPA